MKSIMKSKKKRFFTVLLQKACYDIINYDRFSVIYLV